MKRFGLGLLVLICVPIALVALGLIGTEINKAYWDREVKNMCRKDGGVTVYEKVELNRKDHSDLINSRGVIMLSDKSHAKNDPYYILYDKPYVINEFNPYVWRTEYSINRTLDDKEIGKYVSYSRRGGDFPTGILHESSFGCKDIAGFESDAIEKIFTINGE